MILCFLTWFSLWVVSFFFGFTLILHFPTNPSFGTLQSSPPCPLFAATSSGSRKHCGNLWDLDYIASQPSSKDSICTCPSLKSIIQILFYISHLDSIGHCCLQHQAGETFSTITICSSSAGSKQAPQHHVAKICLLLLFFLDQVPIYERPSSWIDHFWNHFGYT